MRAYRVTPLPQVVALGGAAIVLAPPTATRRMQLGAFKGMGQPID